MAQDRPAPSASTSSRFDIGTPVGIIGGFAAVLIAFLLDEGNPVMLLKVSAAILVIGGTIMATIISFRLSTVLKFPGYIRSAFFEQTQDPLELVQTFVRLAEKARREGLLSLEDEAQQLGDPFLRDGIQEVVDGTPPEQIEELLEIRIAEMEARHREGAEFFEQAGGFAPTMGIIGTVMGLVNTLAKLAEAGTEKLGESIATAFIATLYGIGTANLFWLPISKRLRQKSEAEAARMRMMVAGILAIQQGDAPRLVRTKLEGFLSPDDQQRSRQAGQTGPALGAAETAGAR